MVYVLITGRTSMIHSSIKIVHFVGLQYDIFSLLYHRQDVYRTLPVLHSGCQEMITVRNHLCSSVFSWLDPCCGFPCCVFVLFVFVLSFVPNVACTPLGFLWRLSDTDAPKKNFLWRLMIVCSRLLFNFTFSHGDKWRKTDREINWPVINYYHNHSSRRKSWWYCTTTL